MEKLQAVCIRAFHTYEISEIYEFETLEIDGYIYYKDSEILMEIEEFIKTFKEIKK